MKLNYIKYCSLVILIFFSSLCYAAAGWVSGIDKKYINVNHDLYIKTMEAKNLISEWKGESVLLKEASTLLNEVINKDPSFLPVYVQIARFYSKAGHKPNNKISNEALAEMEKYLLLALEINPDYGYAYAMMGFTKMKSGQLDEANKYFIKAEKTGTTYPYLKSQRAELLLKMKKPEEAIKMGTEGFYEYLNQPKIAVGYTTIIIYATQKIRNGADQQEFWQKKRLEIDPSAWSLGDYSRFLLYVKQDYDKSIEYAEKALKKMNYGMGRLYLAAAHYGKWEQLDKVPGQKKQAHSHFMKAQDIFPDTDLLLKKIYTSKLINVYIKILNYNIKLKNAKKDLDRGSITKAKFDEIASEF